MHVIVMFKLKVIVEPHGSTSFVVSSNLIADRLTIIAFHGNGRVSTNTDGTAAITTIYNSCCSNAQPSRCRFSKLPALQSRLVSISQQENLPSGTLLPFPTNYCIHLQGTLADNQRNVKVDIPLKLQHYITTSKWLQASLQLCQSS